MIKSRFNGFVLMASLLFAFFRILNANAAGKNVVLGITRTDGEKYSVEFVKYNPLAEYYRKNGINARLFNYNNFYRYDLTPLSLYNKLKKYNVVLLRSMDEGIHHLTPAYVARAANVSKALMKYVEAGGGLIIEPRPVRYPNDDDEKYWNLVYKRFGLKLLHEGVFDKSKQIENEIRSGRKFKFFHTDDIVEHPATKNVKGLWLPLRTFFGGPGTPAIKYDSNWKVLVRGGENAKSYRSDPQKNNIDLEKEGTYKSAPPIVAVRTLGKGRIACVAVDPIYTGMNLGNSSWSHIVENKGANGKPGDMMKLMVGLVDWVAKPSKEDSDFGTLAVKPYAPVEFPPACSWDAFRFGDEPVRGIVGAHSSYSDGEGSVEEYVKAARFAGLSFIVFTDPLESLTAEKLKKLKADCRKCSSGGFYACPGVEFTDGAGVRWIFYSEKVQWPEKSFTKGKFTYKPWDGKVIKYFGQYNMQCALCPAAVVSYKQMRDNGAVPENMWWFHQIIPYSYDAGKLVADNFKEYLSALSDLRWVYPISFTRIKSPSEVAGAAEIAATTMKDLPSARAALNARGNPYWKAKNARVSTTYGGEVEVLQWNAVNDQMEQNWRYTKGAQRVQVKFTVKSPAGIKDVKIYDADRGVIRRFVPKNNDEIFSRKFEMTHDKQRSLVLVAEDIEGNKAISNFIFVYCYKQGLFRCGDNLNILGPLGMYWHPDRNQMFPLNKDFRNGELFSVQGWDRGGPDCPMPEGRLCDYIKIKGVGEYPWPGDRMRKLHKQMRVKLGSYNLQIAEMKMDYLVEKYDNKDRPGPAFCSIARKVAENDYFERVDRMIAPMDRMDHFVAWNYRRWREGIKDYKGSYLWHEGEIRFKKDVILEGAVPIPLALMSTPFNFDKKLGTLFFVKDAAEGMVKQEIATRDSKKLRMSGRIAAGGYVAHMNSPVGYMGIIVPKGMNFSYSSTLPGRLYVGLGGDGERIKAGTVLKYAFLSGDFIDQNNSPEHMEKVSKAFNMNGGTGGYPLEIKIGSILNATFFLTLKAAGNESSFSAGPQPVLGIDLPIKVEGLEDNGCAAIYSSRRKWFRFVPVVDGVAFLQEPIDAKNDMWIGNVFVSDNENVKITLVADGLDEGRKPFVELHNPTDKSLKTKVWSPKGCPVFGGKSFTISIPPGGSVKETIEVK
jgi:hypothetical protein